MSALQSVLNLLLMAGLFCVLMPLFGGTFLHKGFHALRIDRDRPLSLCMKVFCGAAGTAYLATMFLGRYLPAIDQPGGLFMTGSAVAAIELVILAVLLRRPNARTVLVEVAAVVVTNVIGYSLVLSYGANSGLVLLSR
jgi:hypothetical protein